MLDRLLDLLLIATLRAWFSRPEAAAPAWYLAMGDPVVGYSGSFALSAAFKRVRGVSPQGYRRGPGLPERQEGSPKGRSGEKVDA